MIRTFVLWWGIILWQLSYADQYLKR